jgi:hypothetical protein
MAIKAHPRTRYLDLETEGLGSHFWEKQWQKMDATLRKRARQGVPRITEIAFLGEAGKGVFGFTDIYDQGLFHRHNVTSKKLRDPKSVVKIWTLRHLGM